MEEEIKEKGGGKGREEWMENGRKERQEGKGPVGMEREREFSSTYPFVILKSDSSHQSNKEKNGENV